MNVYRRTLMASLLAVILALTSLTMAVARGQAAPVGAMVICSGQGSYTVLVDADGQPTGAVHLCPDCAMSLFVAHLDSAAPTSLTRLWQRIDVPEVHGHPARIADIALRARGPPFLI